MKRIPEMFELSEEDIKQAITYWLNEVEIDDGLKYDFNIKFSVDRGAPVGGMSNWSVQVITATAEKE